jgi:hypothetical protein
MLKIWHCSLGSPLTQIGIMTKRKISSIVELTKRMHKTIRETKNCFVVIAKIKAIPLRSVIG